MGKVRLLLVLPLLCLSLAQARADPGATPGLNRATAGGAACCSLTHYNKWEARQGRRALSEVRRRGNLPAPVLGELERNAWAKPFMPKAMMALRKVDKLPGTLDVVTRLARAHDEGGARGAAFEVFAGAALGSRLRRLSTVVKGNEWDGELKDGTVVSMKSITTPNPNSIGNVLRHATKQLIRRTADGRGAMLVVGHEPGATIRKNWKHMAKRLGSDLTVVLVQQKTGKCRTVFSTLYGKKVAASRLKLHTVGRAPRLHSKPRRQQPRVKVLQGGKGSGQVRRSPRRRTHQPRIKLRPAA